MEEGAARFLEELIGNLLDFETVLLRASGNAARLVTVSGSHEEVSSRECRPVMARTAAVYDYQRCRLPQAT